MEDKMWTYVNGIIDADPNNDQQHQQQQIHICPTLLGERHDPSARASVTNISTGNISSIDNVNLVN